jgi:hypothetical protein
MTITPQGIITTIHAEVMSTRLVETKTTTPETMIPIRQGEPTIPHRGATRMLHPEGMATHQEGATMTRILPVEIREHHPEVVTI